MEIIGIVVIGVVIVGAPIFLIWLASEGLLG